MKFPAKRGLSETCTICKTGDMLIRLSALSMRILPTFPPSPFVSIMYNYSVTVTGMKSFRRPRRFIENVEISKVNVNKSRYVSRNGVDSNYKDGKCRKSVHKRWRYLNVFLNGFRCGVTWSVELHYDADIWYRCLWGGFEGFFYICAYVVLGNIFV